MPGFDEAHVLGLAALASSDGGQDSVDAAIRSAASHKPASDLPKLVTFVPFDPAKKTSEATATDEKGGAERIIKGAYTAVVSPHGSVARRGCDCRRTREAGLQGSWQ